MPAKASKVQVNKARACRELGLSLEESAKQAGVAAMTVQRWEKAAELAGDPWKKPPKSSGTAADLAEAGRDAAAAVDAGALAGDGSTLVTLKGMLKSTLQLMKNSEAQGNFTAAQRAGRDAGEIAKTIARLEKAEMNDSDVLRISRVQIAESMAKIKERVAAILSRPMLCAECGRKLAARWGHERASEFAPSATGDQSSEEL